VEKNTFLNLRSITHTLIQAIIIITIIIITITIIIIIIIIKSSESMAAFLGWKDVRLWIKLDRIQQKT
jgi:hypothetical protein